MRLMDERGKRVHIYAAPMSRFAETGGPERIRPYIGHAGDVDRMPMRTLKANVCEGAPCAGCEVMCGYGRRYLQLLQEKENKG